MDTQISSSNSVTFPSQFANEADFREWERQVAERDPQWRLQYNQEKNGYTVVDLYAGWGGSSTGLEAAGFEVVHAANHWSKAIDVHQSNHPDTAHSQCDISKVDPAFFRTGDVLWASPECKNHSAAKGKKRDSGQPVLDVWEERLPHPADRDEDELAQMTEKQRAKYEEDRGKRSRAMMEDVVRIAEYNKDVRNKPFKYIVTENVPAVTDWVHFNQWMTRLRDIGYSIEILSLNSAHAHGRDLDWEGVAQSRDRIYIVATLNGLEKPDLEVRPPCFCHNCDKVVEGKRVWKRTSKTINKPSNLVNGIYGAHGQYIFRCPESNCRQEVVPYQKPAAAVLDFNDRGRTIGEWMDSSKPPAPNTLGRITAGIQKYMLALIFSTGGREHPARPAALPLNTLTSRREEGVALPPGFTVPFGGTRRSDAAPIDRPHPTFTTRESDGLVLSPQDLAPHVLTTLRGGGSADRGYTVNDPLGTVTSSGERNFNLVGPPDAFLLRNNSEGGGDPAQMSSPVYESARTLTTKGHQSLITAPLNAPILAEPLAMLNSYYGHGGWQRTSEPLHTLTTKDRHQLIQHASQQRELLDRLVKAGPGEQVRVTPQFLRECTARMLRLHEIVAFTGLPYNYLMYGSKRDQAAGMGNAVTPNAARWIGERLCEALDNGQRVAPATVTMSLT